MTSAGNPSAALGPRWDLMSRWLARAVFVLLSAFHAGLLLLHVLDGRLFEPATSIRWILGALLLAGFVALRRLRIPVLWGRKAVVLWLLVILLHCHAAFASADGEELTTFQTTLATLVTTVLGATVSALGVLLIVSLRRSPSAFHAHGHALAPWPVLRPADTGFGFASFPRPPPVC